jgi:hypothetical protein
MIMVQHSQEEGSNHKQLQSFLEEEGSFPRE